MKTIKFTIFGNQEDQRGNPIPYFRVTSQSRWSKGTKRYHAWADYVRACYLDALKEVETIRREDFGDYHDLLQKKPIAATNEKQGMTLMIFWANKKHGDSDNVFKGIADALFMNDKYLVGAFDYQYCPDKMGRVDVTINL